jgi:hypothetical protein
LRVCFATQVLKKKITSPCFNLFFLLFFFASFPFLSWTGEDGLLAELLDASNQLLPETRSSNTNKQTNKQKRDLSSLFASERNLLLLVLQLLVVVTNDGLQLLQTNKTKTTTKQFEHPKEQKNVFALTSKVSLAVPTSFWRASALSAVGWPTNCQQRRLQTRF